MTRDIYRLTPELNDDDHDRIVRRYLGETR